MPNNSADNIRNPINNYGAKILIYDTIDLQQARKP